MADIGLSGGPAKPGGVVAAGTAPAAAVIPLTLGRPKRWLTVRRMDGGQIVTVVELLSPSNKAAGKDREKYLSKRQRLLDSRAHFVELDLLRGGQRMPVRPLPPIDYCVLVSRRQRRPNVDLWPLTLRDPLPHLPIPVRRGDSEPLIDLRAVLDRVYDEAGYGPRLYRTDPDPPLSPADAEWAAGLLRPATG